jgi:hypothetical protein
MRAQRVFNQLSHLCSHGPSLVSSVKLGKRHYGLQFFTRTLPCFTQLHSLFYLNASKRRERRSRRLEAWCKNNT